jgi:hypothetical protein
MKLSPSARLVLRCIVDYWNFTIGCAYPTQTTIAKCTGLTEVAVGKAVKELDTIGLIEKKKRNKRIYYYFTLKLLGYLNLTPKIIYANTQTKLGNIPQRNLGNNILKEKENTSFSNLNEEECASFKEDDVAEEDDGLAFAKATVKYLSNTPAFAKKVKELKEKYNL